MIPVLIAIALITVVALVAFRWFQRYRYTQAWRRSEFRGWAFGFLMWFGGIFGHRLPPPPQAKIEFATKNQGDVPPPPTGEGQSGGPSLGGPALPDNTPHEEK